MASYSDLRFAGVLNEELAEMANDFEEWQKTGYLPDDSALRRKGAAFGPTILGATTAALFVFREIYNRSRPDKPASSP